MKYLKLMLVIGFALTISVSTYAQGAKYIGANGCKMCHNKPEKGAQHAQWLKTTHSKAYSKLDEAGKKNPDCLKCHSTAGSVNKSLIATLKVDEGVSCESCHGPGSMYKTAAIMKNREQSIAKGMIIPTEATCKACHTGKKPEGHPADKKPWNYAEFNKVINHPDPTLKK
ncbi:MAG TPA: multiheme c-type cytochrome [Draconibacterium sp.]|nr:multiheme c-type cytochrome [Draconibacterium sp.]